MVRLTILSAVTFKSCGQKGLAHSTASQPPKVVKATLGSEARGLLAFLFAPWRKPIQGFAATGGETTRKSSTLTSFCLTRESRF
jgi:hypothetical protein